ncbi:MAG: exopolysaccharide production protein ExoZ, partial [Acetobacteraceae bacterium]|nr:exopolysaccharide production protein ExoZ [Acetobacteraceae bacterium]
MTFVSLQALRGLAALGVVLFHLLPFEAKYLPGGSIVPPGFSAGRAGVDLFFVLSG